MKLENIVSFSIRNWRMTIGIMIFAVIGGLLALSRLPIDAEPDIPVPFINVRVVLPGVSPEDAERLLIRPLETELKSIDGLKTMDAVATTNAAYVIMEFAADFDQDQAFQDVLEKVDRARAEFPEEALEPLVEEVNTSSFPIFVVNLYGNVPERVLQTTAKDLQRKLESIPQVLGADIAGERTDVLEAVIDPALVESLGISFGEIATTVQRNNALITAGRLETESGRFNVKLPGLIEDEADLSQLIVRSTRDGATVRMSDIATVRRGYTDVDTYARFRGQPSVGLEITKRTGENIIDTIDAVKVATAEFAASSAWPDAVTVEYSNDKSRYIFDMVRSLTSSIVNAVILVFIVCIAALGLRSALFVGWAIPASFLMAMFLFWVQGQTINMMIMFGLILSVGVLVDSAIVIIEYADRKLAEGLDRRAAFEMAGKRMFWPIISSTATTLAAFLPLLFWNSLTGKFMAFFPLTMIYVLSASTVMALIFLPTLGALIGPKTVRRAAGNANALSGRDGDPMTTTGFVGGYVRVVNRLLDRPFLVIAATVLICALIVMNFGRAMGGDPPKPVEFFTQTPSDEVYVLARSRGNTTPADDLAIAQEIERRVLDNGIEGVRAIYTVAGTAASGGTSGGGGSDNPNDTAARLYFELEDFADRRSVMDIMADLSRVTADIPGVYLEVTANDNGPPIGKDVEVQLSGDDREAVARAAETVRAHMYDVDGLIDIEDTLPLPGVEWEIEVDRVEAGRLGLDVASIGAAVQFVTEGTLVGKFRPLDADEEVDIRIRYPANARDLDNLDALRVQTTQGPTPLGSVVERRARPQESQITRRDLAFVYEVKANAAEGEAPNVLVNDLKNWLATEADLPVGVEATFLGQEEENAEAAEFGKAAGMAVLFMMGIILLLQFNSFYHVFLTLLSVILSIFGVLLGLTYYPYVSMVLTMTGVIALAGIVVNNNIVLIDTYQRLTREGGFNPREAALRTAAQRSRPVVLTTITTVVGLMPLVIGWDANIATGVLNLNGSQTSSIWMPVSFAIVSGLSFATLLTLFLTPVLLSAPYVVSTGVRDRIARFRGKSGTAQRSPIPAPAE